MNASAEAFVAWAVAAVGVLLTAAHLLWAFAGLRDVHESRDVQSKLRTLSALTIRNFPDRVIDSSELFWKAINREGNPMRDYWGTEFRLSSREEGGVKRFFWSSAGPDRIFGTRDDVRVEVPYPNGPATTPDIAPGESPVPPPISMDAK